MVFKGFFTTKVIFSASITFLFLLVATGINFLFALLDLPEANIVLIYLLCVIFVTSLTDGMIYGIIAGGISILSFNIFFTEPYFSFSVNDNGYVVTFFVMITAAIFISTLTSKIKKTAKEVSKREKQAIEERYRANLLRAISHDIRTPLSSIIGNTEMLLSYLSDEDIIKKVRDIHDDARWLHSLVENILNLTRLRDGRLIIEKMPEALEEVIEVAVRRTTKLHPSSCITVDVPSEYFSVPMDTKLIEQATMNLLENAIKHNKEGVKIEVKVEKQLGTAVVTIKDNGCGLSESDLPRLFEMFYTKDGNEGGSKGLGLAICEAIIKAHGGEITAKNRLNGKGAEFTFTLPLEDSYDQF